MGTFRRNFGPPHGRNTGSVLSGSRLAVDRLGDLRGAHQRLADDCRSTSAVRELAGGA